jgi:hypothetical protein
LGIARLTCVRTVAGRPVVTGWLAAYLAGFAVLALALVARRDVPLPPGNGSFTYVLASGT